jgi:putative intracellular protease/amidase
MTTRPFAVGAILYPGFEMLDLFGPLEMFSLLGTETVQIHMVAEQAGPVASAMGAEIGVGPRALAEYGFDDAPPLDMLLLPGGFGTVPELSNDAMLTFLRDRADHAQVVASVCTGSAILARAGLLDGHRATSNKQFFQLAVSQSDKVDWVERARWVEDGKFAIIERLFGAEAAQTVAAAAEYTRHTDAGEDPFADDLNALAGLLSS